MNKILIIVFILFTSSIHASWFWDKTLADYKSEFRDNVVDTVEQQKETNTGFNETKNLIFTFASLLHQAKESNVDFKDLHNKWLDTKSEIEDLNTKFRNLVESADSYFYEASQKAKKIDDFKLKKTITHRIVSQEESYTNRLIKTKNSLVELSIAHKKLEDVIIFLEIDYSLKSFDQELNNRFSEIDAITKSVMKDFDLLYKDSQELLSGSL